MEIKPETVCHIVFHARALNADDEMSEDYDEEETQATALHGDIDEEALEDKVVDEREHEPAFAELKTFIDELAEDEQCELVALAWLGRGDGTKGDWADLVNLAAERHTDHTAEYLLGMPLLADYLNVALETFDISCEEFEGDRR